jgi:hypothetical protein
MWSTHLFEGVWKCRFHSLIFSNYYKSSDSSRAILPWNRIYMTKRLESNHCIVLWSFKLGTQIRLVTVVSRNQIIITTTDVTRCHLQHVLATKVWPLNRSSSCYVAVSINLKNTSTRNFFSGSAMGSSLASSSKKLRLLLSFSFQ